MIVEEIRCVLVFGSCFSHQLERNDWIEELGKRARKKFHFSGDSWDSSSIDTAVARIGWFAIGVEGEASLGVWTFVMLFTSFFVSRKWELKNNIKHAFNLLNTACFYCDFEYGDTLHALVFCKHAIKVWNLSQAPSVSAIWLSYTFPASPIL